MNFISVIMPVHNGMPHLPETVDAILRQSFRDFEFIVIDDGSTDESTNYLKSVEDDRLVYHRLERAGLVEALNCGLKRARGELVARIDADDIPDPSRLEKQLGRFRSSPDLVLQGCGFDYIDQDGNLLDDRDENFTTDLALRWMLLFANPFLHPGAMFLRGKVLEAGGYRKEYYLAEDYELWTRLSRHGTLANHPDCLMKKRVHPGSVSIQNRAKQVALSDRVAGEYASGLIEGMSPTAMTSLHAMYSNSRVPSTGELKEFARTFELAVRHFQVAVEGHPQDSPARRELRSAIQSVRDRFRWRCLQQTRSHLNRPWKAFHWISHTKYFDPDHGTIRSIMLKKLRMGT